MTPRRRLLCLLHRLSSLAHPLRLLLSYDGDGSHVCHLGTLKATCAWEVIPALGPGRRPRRADIHWGPPTCQGPSRGGGPTVSRVGCSGVCLEGGSSRAPCYSRHPVLTSRETRVATLVAKTAGGVDLENNVCVVAPALDLLCRLGSNERTLVLIHIFLRSDIVFLIYQM